MTLDPLIVDLIRDEIGNDTDFSDNIPFAPPQLERSRYCIRRTPSCSCFHLLRKCFSLFRGEEFEQAGNCLFVSCTRRHHLL